MPTMCDLKLEAKRRGLKGYSKLRKAELERLLGSGATSGATSKKPKKKRRSQLEMLQAETSAFLRPKVHV